MATPDRAPPAVVMPLFFGLAGITVLLAANTFLWPLIAGGDYFTWLWRQGFQLSVVSGVVAIVWGGLDRHIGLISAHPLHFLGAHLQLIGLPIFALGTALRQPTGSMLDRCLSVPLALLCAVAMLVWLVVIAPAQYLFVLLCGAPARLMANAPTVPIARLAGSHLSVTEAPRDAPLTDNAWSVSLAQKPVAFTHALIAGLLYLAKLYF